MRGPGDNVVSTGLTVEPNPSAPGGTVVLRGTNFRGFRGITVNVEGGPAPGQLPAAGDAFSDEMGDWEAEATAPPADSLKGRPGRRGATIMLTASDGSLYDGPTRRITVSWRVQEGGSSQ